MEKDVVIIGAGVVGSAIARELARYRLDLLLLEREDDVAMGTSKANSGIIHAGYDNAEKLRGRLNISSSPVFDRLCAELGVPFKRIGSLVVGFDRGDRARLEDMMATGERLGVGGLEIVSGERLRGMEPNLHPGARCALHAPTAGIISPHELTIALADSAVLNGVEIRLETPVVGLERNGETIIVETSEEAFRTRIVINAAGLHADDISRMAGNGSGRNLRIHPHRGEYFLFDKKYGGLVNHVLFPMPVEGTKGVLVTPTVHGNLMIGPNSRPVEDREDKSTTRGGLAEVRKEAERLIPGLPGEVIAQFAGLRAREESDDFVIAPDGGFRGLIHAAGIQSPGLSAAPAVAEMVVELVREVGGELEQPLRLEPRTDFRPGLPRPLRLSELLEGGVDPGEWQRLWERDPDYGQVICRCEHVTRGEILAAIRRPVPARSLDAVKRRTRAGMGRCQGGFCEPRVLEILAEEFDCSPLDVTRKGHGSEILMAPAKELLRESGTTRSGEMRAGDRHAG